MRVLTLLVSATSSPSLRGGHWRQSHLKAIDPGVGDTCLLCGAGRDDYEHMWICPALKNIHAQHQRIIRCKQYLPIQLRRHGIAPHVATDPGSSLWGIPMLEGELSPADAKWIGKGVGANLSSEELHEILQHGANIHELMTYHASYEPIPEKGGAANQHKNSTPRRRPSTNQCPSDHAPRTRKHQLSLMPSRTAPSGRHAPVAH